MSDRTLCRCTVCKAVAYCSVSIPVHFGNEEDLSTALVCDSCYWRFTLSGSSSKPLRPSDDPKAMLNTT